MSGLETERRGSDARVQYARDFDAVLEAERALIAEQRAVREVDPDAPLVGVALSGGGIRSSTFGLGVLEALAAGGVFRRIDYLSTVSGGGFIGTALNWFLAHTDGRFPFTGRGAGKGPEGVRVGDYMRLHANYLDHRTPGADDSVAGGERQGAPAHEGFSVAGLLAVVGQQMVITMLVYGGLLIAGFFVLHSLDSLLRPLKAILALELHVEPTVYWLAQTNFMMLVGLGLFMVYLLLAPYFSLRMYLASRLGKGRKDEALGRRREYRLRLRMERTVTAVIVAALLSVIVGSVPLVAQWVATWVDHRWIRGGAYGLLATVGGLLGLFQNGVPREGRGLLGRILQSPLAVRVTAVVTLYALLLVAHTLAMAIHDGRTVWFFWVLLAVVLGFGFWSDLNTLGSHRMYRDRLMESFMPQMEAVATGQWQPSYRSTTRLLDDAATASGPYHLYNTALSTLGSSDPRLHVRGADSFVLAPLFSGSGATGWRRTSSWPRRKLTVATAMAVSAAAVNPGAGSAGRGVTTGWGVSTLLALLNLRLGYWVDNPDPDLSPRGRRQRPGLLLPGRFPVAFRRTFPWIGLRSPVLLSLLPHPLGLRQHEKRSWIQLDDGGAFEATGVYELIRRRADVILLSDATGDERYTFDCLGDMVGRVWNDFGVDLSFEAEERSLHAIRPGSAPAPAGPDGRVLSERAHAVGTIRYPARGDEPAKSGILVILKAALIPGLPVDVLAYRAAHPDFPNESTFNQFFDERQFEAYRQLGYYVGMQMLDDASVTRRMEARLAESGTTTSGTFGTHAPPAPGVDLSASAAPTNPPGES